MFNIRQLNDSEFEKFAIISNNAYPTMKVESIDKLVELYKGIDASDKENKTFSKPGLYGCFDEGNLIGGMRLIDYQMNMFGYFVKTGGIGAVAVDLLRKKEKVCLEMVKFYLNQYKEDGAAMAILYPFRPDFYKKMGFGYGAMRYKYKVSPKGFKNFGSRKNLVYLKGDDLSDLMAFIDKMASKVHGYTKKFNKKGYEKQLESHKINVLGYKDNGKLKGYMIFDFKKGSGDNFLTYPMVVNEMIYENCDVLKQFSTFLHTQADQVERVELMTFDKEFYHFLDDVSDGSDVLFPSVYHKSTEAGVGIMYKILDFSKFFEQVKGHKFGSHSFILKLKYTDKITSDDILETTIHFKNGKAKVIETDDCDVTLAGDISEISSLFIGALEFKSGYIKGLFDISDEKYTDILNETFSYKSPEIETHF